MPSRRTLLKMSLGAMLMPAAAGPAAAWRSQARAGTPHDQDRPARQSILRLDSNENSLGMSPEARKVFARSLDVANRYPDGHAQALRDALAADLTVSPDQILLTNGSTASIRAIVQSFRQNRPSTAEGRVVAQDPTFGIVERLCRDLGLAYHGVPTGKDFAPDMVAMEKAARKDGGPVLVYMVTPNNPTGVVAPTPALFDWIRRADEETIFLIDEAYHDYVDAPSYESAVRLIRDGHRNVIVTRTFSKLHGMAGLRVGYAVAHKDTMADLSRFSDGWNINSTGLMVAKASLADTSWRAYCLRQNTEARAILTDTLDTLGLDHIPGHTNFVLHRIAADHADYKRRMADHGVLVGRYMRTGPGWNRLSLGTPDEMRRFVDILTDFRRRGWA